MNHAEKGLKKKKNSFFNVSDLGFESENFHQFWFRYFVVESGSVNPHTFADPDPKHCC